MESPTCIKTKFPVSSPQSIWKIVTKFDNPELLMSNAEALNQYIKELFDYWDGKNDDFEPIPISKEVDDEMQKDSFY